MAESIVHVVARALRWHMDQTRITEASLGEKAGVSPRTVANFLRPEKRGVSASGKVPSGKLTELEMIASALGVQFVDLVTDMSPAAREQRKRQAMALELLLGSAATTAPTQSLGAEAELGGALTQRDSDNHPQGLAA